MTWFVFHQNFTQIIISNCFVFLYHNLIQEIKTLYNNRGYVKFAIIQPLLPGLMDHHIYPVASNMVLYTPWGNICAS